jgi:Lrp/AsnC family transcriptional regulator for asnA, asnC and gidA
VSQRVVRKRFNELRDRGVLVVTTIADPELLGYQLTALLGVTVDPAARLSDVTRRLASVTGAFYVVMVAGRYNVLVEVTCRGTDALVEIIDDEISQVPGVVGVEAYPYLRLQYQNPAFEAAHDKRLKPGDVERKPAEFDRTDQAIIGILNKDGRVPYQAIADELGISESQVRQRLKRMTDSGSLRVMALTIPRGVGFETAALIGIRVAPGFEIGRMATELARLPAVIYVAICTGRFDIFAEVVAARREELLTLLDSEIRRLPGIERAEPWIYLQLHYRTVRPMD